MTIDMKEINATAAGLEIVGDENRGNWLKLAVVMIILVSIIKRFDSNKVQ
ncbi:MAG: hypothetical protein ACFWUA_04285 [Sporanaerobacter sp.]